MSCELTTLPFQANANNGTWSIYFESYQYFSDTLEVTQLHLTVGSLSNGKYAANSTKSILISPESN